MTHGMTDWPGNSGKMASHRNFKLSFCNRLWDIDRGFLLQFGVIWNFGCQGYSTNCKLTIVKQGMTDWLSNDLKMTSGTNLKVSISWDVFIRF